MEAYSRSVGSATRAAAQKSHANRTKIASTPGLQHHASYESYDLSGVKVSGRSQKGAGRHGKFTWGKPGDEAFMPEPALGKDDPNYDSFEEEDLEGNVIYDVEEHHANMARKAGISLNGFQGGGHVQHGVTGPSIVAREREELLQRQQLQQALPEKIPLKVFKQRCVEIVSAYLLSEDVSELKSDLEALRSPMLHYEFVRRGITLAMERNARERELMSLALSELYGIRTISAEQFGKGFERLFEVLDDLVLDIPGAKKHVSQFLARAVADEILPPSFVSDPLIERLGGEVIEQAKILLSIKHGLVRLDHVWGTTSHATVEELKQETKMILQEFLNSSDLDEACACIKRLNVPFFHHEVVKRAVVLSLDCREREQAMMSSLLAELSSREIISEMQMEMGFCRLYEALADLELDAPGASRILDVFLKQAVKDRCLMPDTAKSIRDLYKHTP